MNRKTKKSNTSKPRRRPRRSPLPQVVQITGLAGMLAALCEDGTIWTLKDQRWERLPDIPG